MVEWRHQLYTAQIGFIGITDISKHSTTSSCYRGRLALSTSKNCSGQPRLSPLAD